MKESTDYQNSKNQIFNQTIELLSFETFSPYLEDSGFIKTLKTNEIDDVISRSNYSSEKSSVIKLYPHLFDEETEAGAVIACMRNALRDAELALDAYDDNDFQELSTRIFQIAAAMKKASPLTTFNESLGAVVSYIRRATLAIDIVDISRSALNALIQALHSIIDNPMLDLDDASDLVDNLSDHHWNGDHQGARRLVAVLLKDFESDNDELKSLLSTMING